MLNFLLLGLRVTAPRGLLKRRPCVQVSGVRLGDFRISSGLKVSGVGLKIFLLKQIRTLSA